MSLANRLRHTKPRQRQTLLMALAMVFLWGPQSFADEPLRVFIFAGQSNMVGSDSHVEDVDNFPPFQGLGEPQADVLFSYCLGRENKKRSEGWTELKPIDGVVGPELSFARKVKRTVDAPIAIIKVAAGGTHLGGDWNPDEPIGFEMYPLLLTEVRTALDALKQEGREFRLEGFMWHQGENDMFNEEYMKNYGANLTNFVKCVRRDLEVPDLRFYVGELCTKTIWGMDLRPRMYAISLGQKAVANKDPLVDYVPTSHVGVEIGNPVGLHYHYGTLGQLEHGENYAEAYLHNKGHAFEPRPRLETWPIPKAKPVKIFVLAGHRNMEGERAFVQDLESIGASELAAANEAIPFRYNVGAGFRESADWEALGPIGLYDNFGPELSFAKTLTAKSDASIVIAKFTDSGSQIVDWSPEGSAAKSRHVYPKFIDFVHEVISDVETQGHPVELAGIFYHVGENDMSFYPFRRDAAENIQAMIKQSRADLDLPDLPWFISQQPPTDAESVNKIDVVKLIGSMTDELANVTHIYGFELPPQPKRLVLNSAGVVELGKTLAKAYLDHNDAQ